MILARIQAAALGLAKWELWLVGAGVLAGFISARALPWTVVLAAAFWPVRWLAFRRFTLRTAADWPLLVLCLLMPMTLWATALPDVTWPQVERLLAGIGLYYALANAPASWPSTANRLARLRWMVTGAALATLGLSAFAFFSVDWAIAGKLPFIPGSLYSLFPRLVSDTANPNVMGGNILILLVVLLGLLFFAGRQLHLLEWMLFGLAFVLGAGVLVLTQSRGAVLALGLCFLFFVTLRWRWGWLVVLMAGISLLYTLNLVGATDLINKLVSNASLGGADGRLDVWSRAVYMIQDFPFTGVGMGSYSQMADRLYPFYLYPPGKVAHAHNLLLQIAADLGIPGLIAWLSTWMCALATAWQVYWHGRKLEHGWLAGLGAGLVGSQLALLAHGMVDAVTWGMVRPAPLVWALWGLGAIAWAVLPERVKRRRELA